MQNYRIGRFAQPSRSISVRENITSVNAQLYNQGKKAENPMNPSFTYNLTPSIKFGCGLAAKLGEEMVSRYDEKRVVMISDPGVVGAGLTDMAGDSLKKDGFSVDLFSDLTGEPSTKSLDAAAALIRTAKPSAVIGLGGGSALDVAKLAAVMASADQGAEYYALTANPLPPKAANIVLLPTTAGTGAEVTRTAVFTNSENRKVWAWGHELTADLVILDPELTLSLPESLTAATGLDAMVHAIEACTVKQSHPLTQSFGLHAIRLGIQNLEKAIDHPADLDARGRLLIASTLAGMAIDGVGTGLAHGIGHALGTIAGIHHGRAVTLALDVIDSVGPDGQFLDSPHTLKHLREDWQPALFDRFDYARWTSRGATTLQQRANQKIKDILASHQPEPLSDELITQLNDVFWSVEADRWNAMWNVSGTSTEGAWKIYHFIVPRLRILDSLESVSRTFISASRM